MRASWNWLAEWVDLTGLTAAEVSRSLTTAGIEVEGIERLDRGLELVVVARIVEAEPHPGADKLRVCKVADVVSSDADPIRELSLRPSAALPRTACSARPKSSGSAMITAA